MSTLPALLPIEFEKRMVGVFGEAGATYLAALPETVAHYAELWGLQIDEPFALSYNYVVRATRLRDGLPVVLKVGVPSPDQRDEAASLRHFAGRGAVPLLECDINGGAMLMPRVFPGDTLESVPFAEDDRATQAACEVMRGLQSVPPPAPDFHPWPTAAEWGRAFTDLAIHKPVCPFRDLWDRAEKMYTDLLASSAPPVLLHGDLHHGNILRTNDNYVAIDAKGLWGEPAYEVGALLRNPHGFSSHPDAARQTRRRLDILADELNQDRERLRQWAFSQAVLSVLWYREDSGTLGTSGTAELGFARLLLES